MLDDLAEFLKPREERITFGKVPLVIQELDGSADNSVLVQEEDRTWHLIVRCAFRADSGAPAFTDEDIPKLKRKNPAVTSPLVRAVIRVNAVDVEEESKNSVAVPG